MCFTPDAHAASSTRDLRALLGTCYTSRKIGLKSVNIITLLRFDESSRTVTEFRIPFDSEETSFCINNWRGHGINAETMGNISGMDFAKNVKRLAFVVDNDVVEVIAPWELWSEEFGNDLRYLAFQFHNAWLVSGISKFASEIRAFLTEEDFLSLFSWWTFFQKTMVDGVRVQKSCPQRGLALNRAIWLTFWNWEERVEDAIRKADPRLLSAVKRIWAYRNNAPELVVPEFEKLAELGVTNNTIEILINDFKSYITGFMDDDPIVSTEIELFRESPFV